MQDWILRQPVSEETENNLLSYPPILRHLLFHRGAGSLSEAEKFLSPNYERDLHDPFLMLNMAKAVDRILSAVKAGEKIVVYGDYDCDGIPGSTILHDFFKKIKYENFYVYIPHRHKEGYGLNIPAIENFSRDSVSLLITVDNGIANAAEVVRANQLGIDVVITDHHLVQDKIPQAFAILNSKQADDNYPYDMLCGAGVAFKLVQGLIKKWNEALDVSSEQKIPMGWEKWLLDLAGISTIADMVPLTGENRVLAYYGLKVLRRTPRLGLMKLFRRAGIRLESVDEEDVGFTIAPRINAASRMGIPYRAFEMLSTADEMAADNLVDYLEEKNNERKKIVAKMMRVVEKNMENNSGASVIVFGDKAWPPGVVGLAASRIVEKYNRPAFVWGKEGVDEIKGSCRSDGSVNIVDLMTACGDGFFSAMGGHALAGGFSLSEKNLEKLSEKLSAAYNKLLKSDFNSFENKEPPVLIDKEISIDEVNRNLYDLVEKMAPFGVDNPRPIFLISNLQVFRVNYFGPSDNHLKLEFKNCAGETISAVAFYYQEKEFGRKNFFAGEKIDLAFSLENSTFGWKSELRMRIVGIK